MSFEQFEERSLKSMQQELDEYIGQFKLGYFPALSQLARLTEELGELSREVMHVHGEKQKKSTEKEGFIEEELTDVFVNVLIFANSLGIDLTQSFSKDMEKFNKRDKNRYERVDG
ncbi:MAG: nucleotide pyrophosphohydrolase [Streptococcaceae bacterium]|jgi:NTP pyrophosphatase (non-canonical NTP hydrolase)|nr:nucleotide pyrophosphohydrolase [Streptococcaceae bacterium]